MRIALLLAAGLFALDARALDPEERLADPVLEQRARELSAELRCVVCQNQSIDDSDSGIAKDLRRVVREQLAAGATDGAVRDHLVARYGEFVLLRPRWGLSTLLLWLAPVLLIGGALAWFVTSRRRRLDDTACLSPAEEERLARLR